MRFRRWDKTATAHFGLGAIVLMIALAMSILLVMSILSGGSRASLGQPGSASPNTQIQFLQGQSGVTLAAGVMPPPTPPPPQRGLRALYRLKDLGDTSDAEDPDGAGVALSPKGDVALTLGKKAYLWHAGHRTPLLPFDGLTDVALAGINSRGQAVGGIGETSDGAILTTYGEAILWNGTKPTVLGALPDLGDAVAAAINDKGQVAGNSSSASPMENQDTISGVTHAFLWERGKMTDLGQGTVAALNNAGQIAGTVPFTHAEGNEETNASHAALWERGKWRDLSTLPGWTFSVATALDPGGAVVGYCYSNLQQEPKEAFLWRAGQMRDLGPGEASGINPGGQIVGDSGGRAVLWWRGGLCDLNTCLGATHGWALTRAVGVNAQGQIVGFGTRQGHSHALLLTPIHPLRLTRTHTVPQSAQMHLVAAATGGDRITLYWKGVAGAAGFNITRGTSDVPETIRVNRAPVQIHDPGVANGWTDTDRGLKEGVAYVYTATALDVRGREIARSNPSQAEANPNAIPWDTRDAAKIAAKVWANAEGMTMPDEADFGPIMPPTPQDFVAPDGVVYKDPPVYIPPVPYQYLAHPTIAYDATDLGTLGGPFAQPRGLNAGGMVVGNAHPPSRDTRPALPFLWRDGSMQALPILPSESPYGYAVAINASGTVCGYGNTTERHQSALLWRAGSVRVLPSLPGGSSWGAYGINDIDQVAGESADATGRAHMVWWDEAGRLHDLGLGRLAGINASGQVVGLQSGEKGMSERAVRSVDGVLYDLGTLGGPFSAASAINSRGDVVGWSNVAHGSAHGFLYSGRHLINLGVPPSATSSRALALNDAGEIVGTAITASGRRAILWQNGTMADLNDLTAHPAGVTLTEATAINGRGQICAVGRSGKTLYAYLLTPHSVR